MEAIRITAHVAGSIALARSEDLALDGLLAYQVLRKHFGEEFYHLPSPHECLYFARLPLEMRGRPSPIIRQLPTGAKWMEPGTDTMDDSLWYWSCSSAQIEVKSRDTQYWNKRFDTQAGLSDHIDFGGRVEKIIIEQGRYKAYHMPLPTLVCNKVVWYAYGDAAKISDLLSPITGISKKRSQGQGHVLRWEIEVMQEDWSEWRDGWLMRPVPAPLAGEMLKQGGGWNMQHIAFRAPQWHPANQMMCITKGQHRAV